MGLIKRLWLHDEGNTFKVIPITTLDTIKIQNDQNQESFTSFEDDYNGFKDLFNNNRQITNNSITDLNDRVSALEAGGGAGSVPLATIASNGLMSKEDKIKLNGISENANHYILPKASTSVLGGIKVDGAIFTIDSSGVLQFNGAAAGGGANTLNDLSDVDVEASLENGDVLAYSVLNNKWTNISKAELINETTNYVAFEDIVNLFDTEDDDYEYDLNTTY